MTLTINTEEDEQRQLLLTIEVPEDRVQKQMRQTARKLARNYNFPGFRQGRAPYNVIASRIGPEALRAEAVEELLQPVFEEALEEVEPEIYAQAEFEDMELEPLVLKFVIPLTPEVSLGDYREMRQEIESVQITDEAVAEALENIRANHQVLEEVERDVIAGDLVTISGKGTLLLAEEDDAEAEEDDAEEDDAEATTEAATAAAEESEVAEAEDDVPEEEAVVDPVLFDTESIDLLMDSEKLFPGTPFVDNIVGMAIGDATSFEMTFPDDFEDEDLAGKDSSFEIEVIKVQSRDLPELNDALAEEEGHESLEKLREVTFENLEQAAVNQAKNDLIDGMVKDMLQDTNLSYPPAAVNLEIDNRLESFKEQVTRSGWEWDDYLKLQTMSEEDLRQNFSEAAEDAVEGQLVLRQFILDEKLSVKEEDVDAKIDERLGQFDDNEMLANSMRDYYKQGAGFDMISSEILMDKVYERMVAILSGSAPSLAELEAEPADESDDAEADAAADAVDNVEAAVDVADTDDAETAEESEADVADGSDATEDDDSDDSDEPAGEPDAENG